MNLREKIPWVSGRKLLGFVGVFGAALLLGLLVSLLAERYLGQGKVLRGVTSEGQNLSGLTQKQVEALLARKKERISRSRFTFQIRGQRKTLTGADLGLTLDEKETTTALFLWGRRGSLFRQTGTWLSSLVAPKDLPLVLGLDPKLVQEELGQWTAGLVKGPVAPQIFYQDGLKFTLPDGGERVNFRRLHQDLISEARRVGVKGRGQTVLHVPVEPAEPRTSLATFEREKARAQGFLAEPVDLRSPDGTETARLTVDLLGRCLASREAEGKFELDLEEACLREVLRGFLSRWEKQPMSAEFEFDPKGVVTVTESETGRLLDVPELKARLWGAVSASPRRAILPLLEAPPKLTKQRAEGLAVKELVSSFVTFHPCCQDRVKNIHHAASKLDGVVLLPGETFSLNRHLGPRTKAAGYLEAPTIIEGEMEESLGGGISQLATTLFNAVLRGGYEIIQRQPHSIYFSRYPEGHEATVSFPEPDLVFKNDTEAGLVIKTEYSPTMIKVILYGDKEGRSIKLDKSRRYDVVPPPKEYEPSEELDPSEQKRLRAGQLGWTVRVSRTVTKRDGSERTEAREVVYRPRPELLVVHPCVIPKGEPGHTGEECPEPAREEQEEELSEEEYFETR